MLDPRDRENLTAYLDGELDRKTAQALEARINLDPEARREVEALKQAWGMLDFLPRPQASPSFTHRTLERLTVADLRADGSSRFKLRATSLARIAGWLVAIVATVSLGLAAGQLWFRAHSNKAVDDAPGQAAAPVLSKEAAEQEWIAAQPKAMRDAYARLEGAARADLVIKLRREEQERRLEWRFAARFWKELDKGIPLPARLADLPPETAAYVTEYLRPWLLSPEEQDKLERAEGKWPLFPLTLVELADAHPPALPGPKGPKMLAELPTDVKNKLRTKAGAYPPKLVKADKRWPDFAVALTQFVAMKKNFILPHELWPWGRNCLSTPVRDFLDRKLIEVMDHEEKLRLNAAEGKWPAYPTAIDEIARAHDLKVPWQTLPGPRERWDNYRNLQQD